MRIENEFCAMGVFDRFGRRRGIGIDENCAVFLADGRHAGGHAGADGADEKGRLGPGNEFIGNARRLFSVQSRVARYEDDFAAENAAALVEFLDGHFAAAAVGLGMQGKTPGGRGDMGDHQGLAAFSGVCQPARRIA